MQNRRFNMGFVAILSAAFTLQLSVASGDDSPRMCHALFAGLETISHQTDNVERYYYSKYTFATTPKPSRLNRVRYIDAKLQKVIEVEVRSWVPRVITNVLFVKDSDLMVVNTIAPRTSHNEKPSELAFIYDASTKKLIRKLNFNIVSTDGSLELGLALSWDQSNSKYYGEGNFPYKIPNPKRIRSIHLVSLRTGEIAFQRVNPERFSDLNSEEYIKDIPDRFEGSQLIIPIYGVLGHERYSLEFSTRQNSRGQLETQLSELPSSVFGVANFKSIADFSVDRVRYRIGRNPLEHNVSFDFDGQMHTYMFSTPERSAVRGVYILKDQSKVVIETFPQTYEQSLDNYVETDPSKVTSRTFETLTKHEVLRTPGFFDYQ